VAAESKSPEAAKRIAIVAARNEADRIGATLRSLRAASPGIGLWVADDASSDDTRTVALGAGATVIGRNRPHGKGGNMTAAATAALEGLDPTSTVLLCDGDLAETAALLLPLVEAVEHGRCDLAVAAFERAGLPVRVNRGSSADLGRPAPRPAYSVLRSTRSDAPVLPSWQDGLLAHLTAREVLAS
jgi:glycosyltransferase involved in cell wall biosynthesis